MKELRAPQDLLPLSPLSLAILLAVADEARHGYAIAKELEQESGGRLIPGAGTLYAALQRMLDDELIDETRAAKRNDDARRRYYALTPFGRDVAYAELERLSHLMVQARDKKLRTGLSLAYIRSGR